MIGNLSSIYQLSIFSAFSIVVFMLLAYMGSFAFRSGSNSEVKNIFLNTFFALLFCVSIYAIIISKGITINLFLLGVLIYLSINNRKEKQQFVKPDLALLLKLSLIFPFIIFITGYYVFPDNIENDIRFYSKISHSLGKFGQENAHHFYNSQGKEFSGTYPYHYTELWLNSIFATILGVTNVIALKYITYPFLISLVFIGFVSFSKNSVVGFLAAFAISIFPLFILFNFKDINYYTYSDFWLRPNFIMYYLGILSLCIFIFEQNYHLVLLTSLIVLTFSITLIPGLLAAIIIFWIIAKRKKVLTWKQFISYNSATAFFLIGMMIFYKLTMTTVKLIPMKPVGELLVQDMIIWRAIVGITAILTIEFLIIPMVIFLLNKFAFKIRSVNEIVISVIFSGIGSIIFFQVFNNIDNAYQFPYFSYCFATAFLIIFVIIILNNLNKRAHFISAAVFILCGCYFLRTYHTIDLTKCSYSLAEINLSREGFNQNEVKMLKDLIKDNSKGSFAFSKNDLKDYSPKRRQSMVVQVGSYLSYLYDNSDQYLVTCKEDLLSDKDEKRKDAYEKLESWLTVFPKYTLNCDLRDELNKGEFDYLVVTNKYVLPDSISKNYMRSGKYQVLILNKNE